MKTFAHLVILVALATFVQCTHTQAVAGDQFAIDLTKTICALVDTPTAPGQPWVDVICTVAPGVEGGIGVALNASSGDGGVTPLASVPSVRLRFASTAEANLFLTTHKGWSKVTPKVSP